MQPMAKRHANTHTDRQTSPLIEWISIEANAVKIAKSCFEINFLCLFLGMNIYVSNPKLEMNKHILMKLKIPTSWSGQKLKKTLCHSEYKPIWKSWQSNCIYMLRTKSLLTPVIWDNRIFSTITWKSQWAQHLRSTPILSNSL